MQVERDAVSSGEQFQAFGRILIDAFIFRVKRNDHSCKNPNAAILKLKGIRVHIKAFCIQCNMG